MSSPGLAEQRRMALHDLLDRHQIRYAEDEEAFRRIQYHEIYLKDWFRERPYWRLLSGRGIYRLERLPSLIAPERGLPRLRSSLAYACLCWALWFAESMATSSRDWFVISELAERVTSVSEGRFTLAERRHREALVQALQLLTDLGALVLQDGDTDRWVSGQSSVDQEPEVMYEFSESAPRLLANFAYDGLTAVSAGNPAQRIALRTGEVAPPLARAWRTLLLGPILWRADDAEAYAALVAAEQQVRRDLEDTLGWQLQCQSEYACIWRTTTARHASSLLLDLYPDPNLPAEERTTRFLHHPILLLLDRLQQELRTGAYEVDEQGAITINEGDLYDLLDDLRSSYRKTHWGATLRDMNDEELVAEVLREMRRIGMLRGPDTARRCHILPPASQIRGVYAATPAPGAARAASSPDEVRPRQTSLFDLSTEGNS